MQGQNMAAVDQMDIDVAIIGGGVAGVACARSLADAGLSVVILEKSRGLGGRLATRRFDGGASADHGAQYATARSDAFSAFMGGTAWQPAPAGEAEVREPWLVGVPEMNVPLKAAAAGLDVRANSLVTGLESAGTGWLLHIADASPLACRHVVSTAPAPQTEALLRPVAPKIADVVAQVEIAPCWSLMLLYDQPLDLDFDAWRGESAVLSWVARNSSKPGRAILPESWTLHAGPDWSLQHLELERDEAADHMIAAFASIAGRDLPRPATLRAHRWRYALTTKPVGQPFLVDAAGTLYAGGDWCLGARLEYAYESGTAIAGDIIAKRSAAQ